MASFFYFNSLSSWKWTFPEGLGGLCHTCGNSEGVGGHQFLAKMENPGRWGGPKWNSLRGGGLDIFWNYTFSFPILRLNLNTVTYPCSIIYTVKKSIPYTSKTCTYLTKKYYVVLQTRDQSCDHMAFPAPILETYKVEFPARIKASTIWSTISVLVTVGIKGQAGL